MVERVRRVAEVAEARILLSPVLSSDLVWPDNDDSDPVASIVRWGKFAQ
jgi:hypothetical protein